MLSRINPESSTALVHFLDTLKMRKFNADLNQYKPQKRPIVDKKKTQFKKGANNKNTSKVSSRTKRLIVRDWLRLAVWYVRIQKVHELAAKSQTNSHTRWSRLIKIKNLDLQIYDSNFNNEKETPLMKLTITNLVDFSKYVKNANMKESQSHSYVALDTLHLDQRAFPFNQTILHPS